MNFTQCEAGPGNGCSNTCSICVAQHPSVSTTARPTPGAATSVHFRLGRISCASRPSLLSKTLAMTSVGVCSFSSELFPHPEAMAEEKDRAVGSSPRAGAAPPRSRGHAPCFGHLGLLWGCLSPGRSVAASYPSLPDGWQHMNGSTAHKGRKKKNEGRRALEVTQPRAGPELHTCSHAALSTQA